MENLFVAEPKPPKTEYRFNCEIIDKNTGEVVASASTFVGTIQTENFGIVSCESIEQEVFSLIRHFEQVGRERYEAANYPTEVEPE